MTRPNSILHELPAAKWTPDEIFVHLLETFDQGARQRPDLFEPYLIRLAGLDEREQIPIMREALRETFALRYPPKRQ
jgi:hypothetical protein